MAFRSKLLSVFSQGGETDLENADPKSAFAAVGKRGALSEISHAAKLVKTGATKEAVTRKPLAVKSTNIQASEIKVCSHSLG
jgi:hypothetical protein